METVDVVIAGAGIIGLSLALDLASHGLRVTVLERGRAMQESSWAAAGMLAAHDPENPPALAELARFSLALYPDYLDRIERLAGKKIPFRTAATIQLCQPLHPDRLSSSTRPLTHSELRSLAPDLCLADNELPHRPGFLLLQEQSLDPRDLCIALPIAAIAAGVRLLEHSPVIAVDAGPAGVLVQTPDTAIAAAHFVNCAGAWAESPGLGRLPPNHPRVAPAKGQMAALRLRGRQTLDRALRTSDIYLVPRGDGSVVIGATVEHAGFDKTVQPQAIARLLQAAAALWPPIAHAEVLESWAGLRPGSADGLPLIGPIRAPIQPSLGFNGAADPSSGPSAARHTRCWIATGHFRNGILLAPGTARALSQAMRGQTPEIDLTPFDPARPHPETARALDRRVPHVSDNPATAAL